jgi:adenosine deaminase
VVRQALSCDESTQSKDAGGYHHQSGHIARLMFDVLGVQEDEAGGRAADDGDEERHEGQHSKPAPQAWCDSAEDRQLIWSPARARAVGEETAVAVGFGHPPRQRNEKQSGKQRRSQDDTKADAPFAEPMEDRSEAGADAITRCGEGNGLRAIGHASLLGHVHLRYGVRRRQKGSPAGEDGDKAPVGGAESRHSCQHEPDCCGAKEHRSSPEAVGQAGKGQASEGGQADDGETDTESGSGEAGLFCYRSRRDMRNVAEALGDAAECCDRAELAVARSDSDEGDSDDALVSPGVESEGFCPGLVRLQRLAQPSPHCKPRGALIRGRANCLMARELTFDDIYRLPKVLLHDHLDGGLRPATVVELARECGYGDLPTTDPEELGKWFRAGADQGDLVAYLAGFAHTVAVMQTRESLTRVAAECTEDLAAEGVVYAEVRFAPELHVAGGLCLDDVVEAVLEGFAQASAGRDIRIYALLTAMRTAGRSREIADVAVRHRDHGVVGFDIAGAEAGSPPTEHLDAFQFVQRENFHITIHAGEAFGLPSIWEAIQICGADRLGHGVRIVDDIFVDDSTGEPKLGPLANYVRDRRIPLELCPTSNVQTGAARSLAEHPIKVLRDMHFRVTVNTDNRLMSGVLLSSEMKVLVDTFGYDLNDLEWLTLNAMKSAFTHFDERLLIINDVIKPGFDAFRRRLALS